MRLGSKVPVTVEAQYYFGGGVPGAEVTWRVFREEYWPVLLVAAPLDVRRRRRQASAARGGRELVVSGQGSLSERGQARDHVRHGAATRRSQGEGSNFIVEADVMDASRRTISGSASLLLAKKALVLGVEPRRGFYMAGDHVECETQSRLPDGTADRGLGHDQGLQDRRPR